MIEVLEFPFPEGLYRRAAEERAKADQLAQEFCLAITIRDPSRKHPVYNQVTQLLEHRQFPHQGVPFR